MIMYKKKNIFKDYFYDRNDQIVQGMFEKARLDLLFMEYNK